MDSSTTVDVDVDVEGRGIARLGQPLEVRREPLEDLEVSLDRFAWRLDVVFGLPGGCSLLEHRTQLLVVHLGYRDDVGSRRWLGGRRPKREGRAVDGATTQVLENPTAIAFLDGRDHVLRVRTHRAGTRVRTPPRRPDNTPVRSARRTP